MKADELKQAIVPAVLSWGDRRIDELAARNPRLHIASVYMKRGLRNMMQGKRADIERGIDALAVFASDENGEITPGAIAEDLMTLFREMEEKPFDLGIISGKVGKGTVKVDIPDNMLTNLLFGNGESLTLTEDDFNELVEMIKE